eukprot:scaffold1141_cov369-Prasinococcus_capsulatus_cf.AAC.9
MSPPIRTYAKDGVALQTAILDGDIQLVATDHAVFNSTQKAAVSVQWGLPRVRPPKGAAMRLSLSTRNSRVRTLRVSATFASFRMA